ncbi:hypothetical protein BCR34DRAFT_602474 [Clohesyomyces aquaticus]|uniref:Uncharacterized protein n=1 Tax=Clohesyomyces aquaticus TaxID=1231657 RepID=A0A1Y1ZIL7_9PLEO|nr:hypothetical protein BCR34DRAFT_602474 [Clohesyomyces aquaticus]
MNEHAVALSRAGMVDEATANKLCQPQHEKGVWDLDWDPKYLDPNVKDHALTMGLGAATKETAKKDVEEKKMPAEIACYVGMLSAAEAERDIYSLAPEVHRSVELHLHDVCVLDGPRNTRRNTYCMCGKTGKAVGSRKDQLSI